MFKIKQYPLRIVLLSGLLPLIFLTTEVSAQYFDTLIFKTTGLYWQESVIYMETRMMMDVIFHDYENGYNCPGSEGKAFFIMVVTLSLIHLHFTSESLILLPSQPVT
ncbi:MAG: hypothetical protein IPG53_05885 [Ignavibacteriales bacterium]|nr:hypothetical protein [Ignavibacteriales bacterium]